MKFICPIYWTNVKKTKKSTTHLIGMNLYRNLYYHTQNKLKKDIEQYLTDTLEGTLDPIIGTYTVHYDIYYKNANCDASNIVALIEKFFLDFAQQANLVAEDNVKHHISSSWRVVAQDKDNPRCEITIKQMES